MVELDHEEVDWEKIEMSKEKKQQPNFDSIIKLINSYNCCCLW
jgi:hypothetical protein